MTGSIWHKLDLLARQLMPFMVTLGLTVLSLLPIPLRGFSAVSPSLCLIAVYYWALYRPGLLPAPAVFGLGLLLDALSGGPLGVNAFMLLVVFGFIASQRPIFHGKSFVVVWWGFLMVAGFVAILDWLLMSMLLAGVVSPQPALFKALTTVALYPVVAWFLAFTHRTVPREDAS